MKVAFDTNVILDALLNRPDAESAVRLMEKVAEEEIIGIISANAITDIYYITRKKLNDNDTREAIFALLSLFNVAPVDGDVCMDALNIAMADYEDAVFAVCAAREGADCIATRDVGFINAEGSPIEALHPVDVLERI